jgi:hypothetical protein
MAGAMVIAMVKTRALATTSKDNYDNGKDDNGGGGGIPA